MMQTPQRRRPGGFTIGAVRRATVLLLGIAVLSATGMPLRLPCCSLRKLASTSIQSDCCPIPGCTLAEREGAAPAIVASAVTPSAAAAASPFVPARLRGLPALPVRVASVSPSPPRGRPALALLSVYRI
jgi:hypothetical protein